MAKLGRRKSAEEIERILRSQQELGQSNAVCARAAGVGVETLKRWKARARRIDKHEPLVEWVPAQSAPDCANLRIEVPGGVALVIRGPWPTDHLATLIRALSRP